MAKQNPNIREEIRGYKQSRIKEIKETEITFMDIKDRSDHKLKVHPIPTNTPQKELHHMDLQETIVLIIKEREREREREIERERKPSSY